MQTSNHGQYPCEVGPLPLPAAYSSSKSNGPISQMEADVRRGFVRKVYGILTVQLILTFVFAAPFPVLIGQEFFRTTTGRIVYWVSMWLSLFIIIGLFCCCCKVIKDYPFNYLFLFSLTSVEAVTIGMTTCMYSTSTVLLALATTAVVSFSLTAFAFFTDIDFTDMGVYLYGMLMCMCDFGFVLIVWSMFAPIPGPLDMFYSACGVLIFSFYIIYDTQLIIGGEHKTLQFNVDDYVFAALALYLDIINLFVYLLSLLGSRD